LLSEEYRDDTSTTTPRRPGRWAGVDWSWTDHAVCVVDDTGSVVERLTVKHTAAGLAKLVTALHRHRVDGVAIERGDGPVVQALLDADLPVFVVASRQVTALRTRYGTAGTRTTDSTPTYSPTCCAPTGAGSRP
jgi:Transposase